MSASDSGRSFRIVKAQARDASRDVRRCDGRSAATPPHCKTCSFSRLPSHPAIRHNTFLRDPQHADAAHSPHPFLCGAHSSLTVALVTWAENRSSLPFARRPLSASSNLRQNTCTARFSLHAAAGPPCDLSRNGPKPPVASQTSRLLSRLSQLLSLSLLPLVLGAAAADSRIECGE